MSPLLAKALVALVAVASVAELAAGKNHTIRWSVGQNYGEWLAANPVRVGDTVVFTYGPPHTVDEINQADYESCSFASPISNDDSGSTAFTFDKAGTRYFACATASHCSDGQKLAITVADGGAESPAPTENSAQPMAGTAELAVKVMLGLGVGAAALATF